MTFAPYTHQIDLYEAIQRAPRLPGTLDDDWYRHLSPGARAVGDLFGLSPEYQDELRRRMEAKTTPCPMTGCYLWSGACGPNGYGNIGIRIATGVYRHHSAHRLAWLLDVGAIPDGFLLDHLCRNPACVNVRHLEPVTHRTNIQRGVNGHLRDECMNGHPLGSPGARNKAGKCKTCALAYSTAYRHRQANRLVTTAGAR